MLLVRIAMKICRVRHLTARPGMMLQAPQSKLGTKRQEQYIRGIHALMGHPRIKRTSPTYKDK